jgi:hypothetical protein
MFSLMPLSVFDSLKNKNLGITIIVILNLILKLFWVWTIMGARDWIKAKIIVSRVKS